MVKRELGALADDAWFVTIHLPSTRELTACRRYCRTAHRMDDAHDHEETLGQDGYADSARCVPVAQWSNSAANSANRSSGSGRTGGRAVIGINRARSWPPASWEEADDRRDTENALAEPHSGARSALDVVDIARAAGDGGADGRLVDLLAPAEIAGTTRCFGDRCLVSLRHCSVCTNAASECRRALMRLLATASSSRRASARVRSSIRPRLAAATCPA